MLASSFGGHLLQLEILERSTQNHPGILPFSKTSFPAEESQGLAELNLDHFVFVLKMCIYLIK